MLLLRILVHSIADPLRFLMPLLPEDKPSHLLGCDEYRDICLLGRSGLNLEPGTMRVNVTNGPRNGLNIGRKVGPALKAGGGGC